MVIWLARTGQFKAYPKFAAPRRDRADQTPEELAAQMEQVEQAARRPRGRSRPPGEGASGDGAPGAGWPAS